MRREIFHRGKRNKMQKDIKFYLENWGQISTFAEVIWFGEFRVGGLIRDAGSSPAPGATQGCVNVFL